MGKVAIDSDSSSGSSLGRAWRIAVLGAFLIVSSGCQDRGRSDVARADSAVSAAPESAPEITPDTGAPSSSADTAPVAIPTDTTPSRADSPTTSPRRARSDTARPAAAPAPAQDTATRPAPTPAQGGSQDTATTTPPADAPLRDAYHQAPRDTVTQAQYTGWKYFNLNCARCHGEDVMGTTIAPHLIESFKPGNAVDNKAEYDRVVDGSRVAKGMPKWTGLMDKEQLDAVYEYIKGRSEGKIGPGRPAVRG